MIKFSRFFVALFLLCFALNASAAKEDPADCTPDNIIGLTLHDYGLVAGSGVDKIKLLDSQVIGKTTGQGTEKGIYDKGEKVTQYTHLVTYPPLKKGDAPVKVIVITECADTTIDASPLVYLISPVYMKLEAAGSDSGSILNSRNVARKALQEKIKEYNKKLDELGKEK
jgi:hypothetical protein